MKNSHLEELRSQIDLLDDQLVEVLARRFRLTDEIGRLKRDLGLPAVDAQREQQQRTKIRQFARQHGLSEDIALKVHRAIIDEVVIKHRKV